MSSGVTPAWPKAFLAERTHGDSVKSVHSLIVVCEMASPVAEHPDRACWRSRVRCSSLVSTIAPPPSERMQQCSLVRGSAIIRDDWTSSMVMGSR